MADIRTAESELMTSIAAMDPAAIELKRKELLDKNHAVPADDWPEEDLTLMVLYTSTLRSKSRAGAPKAKASTAKPAAKSKPLADLLDSI